MRTDACCKETCLTFQVLSLHIVPDLLVNPFIDINSDETGVTELEEELVSIQNYIELKPKFKKLYQGTVLPRVRR